ncbi:MAG: hypothetical protein AB2404_08775, partial [Planifilum fimeticola]
GLKSWGRAGVARNAINSFSEIMDWIEELVSMETLKKAIRHDISALSEVNLLMREPIHLMYLRALDKVNQQLQEVRSKLSSTGVKIIKIDQKEDSCEVVVRISNNDFHYPFLNEHIRAKCSEKFRLYCRM